MDINKIIILIEIILVISYLKGEKVRYMKIEQTGVTYLNPVYINYLNHTARRWSRKDPMYYYDLNFDTSVTMDNKVHLDFYFYEWLTNQYKPTFVEMHFKWCDLLDKNPFFGAPIRQALNKPCPQPPGIFNLHNMTIPVAAIPASFPFTKGRIICNITASSYGPKEWAAEIYTNMEIKTMNRKN